MDTRCVHWANSFYDIPAFTRSLVGNILDKLVAPCQESYKAFEVMVRTPMEHGNSFFISARHCVIRAISGIEGMFWRFLDGGNVEFYVE